MSFSKKKWSEQITSDLLVRKYIFTSFYGCWDEAIFQFSIFLRCVKKLMCCVGYSKNSWRRSWWWHTVTKWEISSKYYMGVSRCLRIKYYLAILEKKLQKIKNKTNLTKARYFGGFFTAVWQLRRPFAKKTNGSLHSVRLLWQL